PWRGKVAFTAAVAGSDEFPGTAVTIDIVDHDEAEQRTVARHLGASIAESADRIAVLVRARAHLDPLLGVMRREGIVFAAVGLDALAQTQAILAPSSPTHP